MKRILGVFALFATLAVPTLQAQAIDWVIEPTYQTIWNPTSEVQGFKVKPKRGLGLIDARTGRVVVQPTLASDIERYDGQHAVYICDARQRLCLADSTGFVIIPRGVEYIGEVREERVSIRIKDDEWAVLDTGRNIIYPPQPDAKEFTSSLKEFKHIEVDEISPFSDGIAVVHGNTPDGAYRGGLLTADGLAIVLNTQLRPVGMYRNGAIRVAVEGGEAEGYTYLKLAPVDEIPDAQRVGQPSSSDVEWVARLPETERVFPEPMGATFLVDALFDSASDFQQGLARVEFEGKHGLLRNDGQVVLPMEYDEITDFVNGYARVQRGTEYGYVDASGVLTVAPQYVEADEEVDEQGFAAVCTGSDQCMQIDMKGIVQGALSPSREAARNGYVYTSGHIQGLQERRCSLSGVDGQVHIPQTYCDAITMEEVVLNGREKYTVFMAHPSGLYGVPDVARVAIAGPDGVTSFEIDGAHEATMKALVHPKGHQGFVVVHYRDNAGEPRAWMVYDVQGNRTLKSKRRTRKSTFTGMSGAGFVVEQPHKRSSRAGVLSLDGAWVVKPSLSGVYYANGFLLSREGTVVTPEGEVRKLPFSARRNLGNGLLLGVDDDGVLLGHYDGSVAMRLPRVMAYAQRINGEMLWLTSYARNEYGIMRLPESLRSPAVD